MSGIKILGTGTYLPERVATNEDFAKIVETSDEWIRTRTGMSQRRFSQGEPTWYMGAMAARQAVEEAGINPGEIGLIIASSVSPDYAFPSQSCMIQRELGAVGSMTIDVNCACSGFVYGMDMARMYLAFGDVKYAVVVGCENLTKFVDYSDRSTCVLFGDGAAAAVVECAPGGMYSSFLSADGNGAKSMACRYAPPHNAFIDEARKDIPDGLPVTQGPYMAMDGKEVYKFATKAMPEAIEKALGKLGMKPEELDVIIPHQANIRIIETAAQKSGLPMDKMIINIDRYGNTSSTTIPLAMDEAIRSGRLKRGDKLCLVGFGAGLTYGAVVFEY